MSNFVRPHHQRIEKILAAMNSELLNDTKCFFAGGTAISLQLNEYRESVDIDFLCSSLEGYRALRNFGQGESNLGDMFSSDVKYLRDVRRDQYGIRTVLEVDGTPIKFEIVSEGRIELTGAPHPLLKVPTLDHECLFAEKLLANADRWSDPSVLSRDIIDLSFMIKNWGHIPRSAWAKADSVYGVSVIESWEGAVRRVSDKKYLVQCANEMGIELSFVEQIKKILRSEYVPNRLVAPKKGFSGTRL